MNISRLQSLLFLQMNQSFVVSMAINAKKTTVENSTRRKFLHYGQYLNYLIGLAKPLICDLHNQINDEYSQPNDRHSGHMNNQYDNISIKYGDLLEKSIKTSNSESLFQQKPLHKNNAAQMCPENISKLKVLYSFYLGQRSRSASIPLTEIPQNFGLYHELPEDVSNLDNLKHYASLNIVFVNNDLEYRHLPIQEGFVDGKRRLFVQCGNKNILPFKKLEHLVQHYANTFAYTDSQGRRCRFPDNPIEEPTHKHII
ncbi:hypothetical protein QQG55_31345 [Brugia pahangi]